MLFINIQNYTYIYRIVFPTTTQPNVLMNVVLPETEEGVTITTYLRFPVSLTSFSSKPKDSKNSLVIGCTW